MEANATFTLPAVSGTLNRNIYYYEGKEIVIDGTRIEASHRVKLTGDQEVEIANGAEDSFILVLGGEPIQEPVAQYGPFVMNTENEIREAFREFHLTQFGGWQWGSFDHVNERTSRRFARHSDGRIEKR